MPESHALVRLARQTIETFVREHRQIDPPAELTAEMRQHAGAFVSLHRLGQLRGCIGTIQPTTPNVAAEVIRNAIAAATEDPRFSPVRRDELDDLDVKVDVLGEPEEVTGLDQLDPRRYGLIVESARGPRRRGLLLPDLDGIDTVDQQVQYTRRYKAGIRDDEPVRMFRFEVKRYT